MPIPRNHNYITACLAMSSVFSVSPVKWRALLGMPGVSAESLIFGCSDGTTLDSLTAQQQEYVVTLQKAIDWKAVDNALHWLAKSDTHHIVTDKHEHWPESFGLLQSAPLVLFCKGDTALLSKQQVAVVGSRRASPAGLQHAYDFSAQLAGSDIVVTSGLACGVDGAAHKGALSEQGHTIAFLGTGPDRTYPYRNRKLQERITQEGGLVASEFFPGTPPKRHHFPQRNRLIAAIAEGTLVVEATTKSGTLITANLAADMGRDVFAIPGSIDNPLYEGCHALIQQGAKLVTNAGEIAEELTGSFNAVGIAQQTNAQKSEDQNLATDKLLDNVEFDVTSVDIITERSALPVSEVLAALLEYELRGLVAAVPGGYVKLRGK
ncbi:DNA-processing protein DprA [Aestuariibacter sp. A3R04]|uniref:DNA-processing protein DprA n=1 Tax=Aestuariibacter sp. A3R04 TaxID=2841571 RepID=UPI001C095960|nr:DNA-processing protein DprA [Aestuariibacter sp. A3R04]MBU3020189.1 DNA-processing protein DprA [Aestuariibacter sp. A3R04]